MSTAIAALPFFGGELSSFDPSDGSVLEVQQHYLTDATGPGGGTWARASIIVPQPASNIATPTWASSASATQWSHQVFFFDTTLQGYSGQTLVDYINGSTVVARITGDFNEGASTQTLHFWSLQSGTLTNNFSITLPSSIQTYDMQVISNTASGSQTIYVGGGLRFSMGGLNHAGFTGWSQVKRYGCSGSLVNIATYWSEMIDDTTSTVGRRVYTARINTPSAVNTGWTGSVSDIDEVILNDSSFIFAASASLIDTFFQSGLSLGTSTILAVGVGARTRVQGAGPAHVDLVVRSAGTNYPSSDIAVNTGFQACFNSWPTDPATTVAWLPAAAASAEEGVESVT